MIEVTKNMYSLQENIVNRYAYKQMRVASLNRQNTLFTVDL